MLGAGFAWGSWQSVRENSTDESVSLGQNTQEPHSDLGPVSHDFWVRVDSLKRILSDRPDDNATRLVLARQLHDAHRVEAAIEHYREYLGRSPDDKQVYFDLAKAHGALGHWDEAAGTMENLLEKQPGDVSAMYNLGAIEANRGRPAEAVSWWKRVSAETEDSQLVAQAETALRRLSQGK